MDFEKVLDLLLKDFEKEGIRYAMMGGFGLGALGIMRSTMDLDFLVDHNDLSKIQAIMKKYDYDCVYKSENVSQYVSGLKIFGEVDFLHAFRDKSLSLLERSKLVGVFDGRLKIRVLLPEDIIGLKLQALSNDKTRENKEYADIEDVINQLGSEMDWEIIEEYFELFHKKDKFIELREKYGSVK